MTWLNINPKLEPFRRVSAAKALATDPESKEQFRSKNNLSSVEVARLYNNAENLGLDLFSLGEVPFDYIEGEE